MRGYFFDSYALFEILKGNAQYLKLLNDVSFSITKLNLLELHYHLLRRTGKNAADDAYAHFAQYAQELSDDDYREASAFRAAHVQKKFSYIDCIGYAFAQRNGLKFLTGDIAFKGMQNVEFVQ